MTLFGKHHVVSRSLILLLLINEMTLMVVGGNRVLVPPMAEQENEYQGISGHAAESDLR